MMPVGMEMISVVTMKGPASSGAQPVVNIWCAQTMMESAEIATNPATVTL